MKVSLLIMMLGWLGAVLLVLSCENNSSETGGGRSTPVDVGADDPESDTDDTGSDEESEGQSTNSSSESQSEESVANDPFSGFAFTIDSDSGYTNSTSVTITITDDTGVAEYRIDNDADCSDATWTTYPSAAFAHTITSGDGAKTVCLQVRNSDSDESSSVTETVTLDTVNPTGEVYSTGEHGPNTFSGANFTSRGSAADAGSGVASVEVSVREAGANYLNAGESAFDSGTEVFHAADNLTWDFDVAEGLFTDTLQYTFRVKVTDTAGNIAYASNDITWASGSAAFLTGYDLRKKVTISSTNVDSDLTDFPFFFELTGDEEVGENARSDGHDIRFTSSDGTTLLDYERSSFSVVNGISGYSNRKKITIDSTNVDADLENFPLLVIFTNDADIGAVCQSDGDDIRFVASDGTFLDYEKEAFSITTGQATGRFWVNVPLVENATDTDIYIYYGNATASAPTNQEDTWKNEFTGVWHMDEDPSGAAPQVLDSTTYAHNGTSVGSMAGSDLVTGKIGDSITFDGSSQYLDLGEQGQLRLGRQFTIEAWVEFAGSDMVIFNANQSTNYDGFWFSIAADGTAVLHTGDGLGGTSINRKSVATGVGAVTAGWRHVMAVVTSVSDMKIYVDGVDTAGALSGIATVIDYVTFGEATIGLKDQAGVVYNTGALDEVRLARVARSDAWAKFTFANVSEADNEISFAAEEAVSATNSAAFGQFWVKVPTVASASDTDIYMYFGDSGASDGENATNVWDANYGVVAHFSEDPGSVAQFSDSTSNGNDGTHAGSVASSQSIRSELGSAIALDGSDDDIDFGSDASIKPSLPVTVQSWVNYNGMEQAVFGSDASNTSLYYGYMLMLLDDGSIAVHVGDGTGNTTTDRRSITVSAATLTSGYHHIAVVIRGTTDMSVYVDGVDVGGSYDGTGGSLAYDAGSSAQVGNHFGFTRNSAINIDELRVSSVERSAAWVKFESNNILDYSTEVTHSSIARY